MKKFFSLSLSILACVALVLLSKNVSASANSSRDSTTASSEKKSNHYFSLIPLLAWNSYKDEVNSPLTYHTVGLLLAGEIGLENRSVKHNGYTNVFFANQSMNTSQSPYTGATNEKLLTVKFNTSRCYQLAEFWKQRIRYRLGYDGNLEYNHQINYRLENSAYTFAIWANAGIANRFEFPFTVNTQKKIAFIGFKKPQQHLLLAWQFNIPLAGVITRPNFSGIRHFANGEFLSNLSREMGDHLQFISLNNFVMVHSQLELLAPLGNNNRLKIAYAWEGFRYNENFSRVQGVVSAFEIGFLFKLDSRPVIQ